MENKRIKLLMVPSDTMGVGHFRNIWAAQCIQKNFPQEFDVDINHEVRFNDFDYLSQYDIIHFHRQFGPYEEFEKISAELKKRGVIVVMDIDDYWEPPTTHPLYEIVKLEKMSEKIKNNLKFSDYITTTTSCFKTHIKKYNDNVFIIPNALDMEHKMWSSEIEENQTDKCRISWIGGSSHLHDLQIITQSMLKLNNSFELKNKYQIIVCGFDVRGTITEILPNGQRNVRKILPHETVWRKFEDIFTSNGLLLNDEPEYIKWLNKNKREEYPDEYKKNFVRRWTLPLTQYGKHYNYCDVCLAPLETIEVFKELADTKEIVIATDARKGTVKSRPHYFNEVKSELKIIESGMKKKVLIAQNFGIYKELIKNGETGILVSNNDKGWFKAMRDVINNKEYREKLANNLHEFVKDKYDILNVTKERVNVYKQMIEEKNSGELEKKRTGQVEKNLLNSK
jgi:glycosyltransferase involved in cell wall biosynthesis